VIRWPHERGTGVIRVARELGRAFAKGFMVGWRQDHLPAIEVVEAVEVSRHSCHVTCPHCGTSGVSTVMKLEAGELDLYRADPMICCDTIRDQANQLAGMN
jgi:hypothetical protein